MDHPFVQPMVNLTEITRFTSNFLNRYALFFFLQSKVLIYILMKIVKNVAMVQPYEHSPCRVSALRWSRFKNKENFSFFLSSFRRKNTPDASRINIYAPRNDDKSGGPTMCRWQTVAARGSKDSRMRGTTTAPTRAHWMRLTTSWKIPRSFLQAIFFR